MGQTLEERLGGRIRRTENERGWLLDQYDRPFPNKLCTAAAAMMIDDAERTGKAYFSIRDFKVYVLRIIAANDSAEFFKEEMISSSVDKIPLADEISQVKSRLAIVGAKHSGLRGEKLEEKIVLDVRSLEVIGGSQLRLAGYTIAELAKHAFTRVQSRGKLPYLDRQVRQEEGSIISYKLVK